MQGAMKIKESLTTKKRTCVTIFFNSGTATSNSFFHKHIKVKVKQTRHRPGVAQRVPGI
jgi:hypothetical protein